MRRSRSLVWFAGRERAYLYPNPRGACGGRDSLSLAPRPPQRLTSEKGTLPRTLTASTKQIPVDTMVHRAASELRLISTLSLPGLVRWQRKSLSLPEPQRSMWRQGLSLPGPTPSSETHLREGHSSADADSKYQADPCGYHGTPRCPSHGKI